MGSVRCKKGCREKTSTTARFSLLAFRDKLGKDEPKYKIVTRSNEISRMSYFFFILACREKTSTTARFSLLAFRDNMGKDEPKFKTVTRSTDISRMSYFFFILALTAVLAVAIQGNQGRHFL